MERLVVLEEHIHSLADILCDSSELISNKDKFGGALGLLPADLLEINNAVRHQPGGAYLFFKDVLAKWRSKEGGSALFSKLLIVLENEKFNAVAGKLKDYIKELNWRPSLEREPSLSSDEDRTNYNSLMRRVSTQDSAIHDKIAAHLYEGNLKESFDALNLGNHSRVQDFLQRRERATVTDATNGTTVALFSKFIDFLLDLGRFADVLVICKSYLKKFQQSTLSETDVNDIEFYMATAYFRLKMCDDARDIFQRTLKSRTRILGPSDFSTLSSKVGYAISLSESGRNREANESLEEALKILEREKPEDPLTLKAKIYQAIVYSRLGRSAVDICNAVLETQRRIEGDWQVIAESTYILAMIQVEMKNYDDAMPVFQDVQRTYERQEISDHPIAIQAEYHIAKIHSAQGSNSTARELLERLKRKYDQIFGPKHEDTLKMNRLYAQVSSRLGKYEQAKSSYQDICKRQEDSTGIGHASTMETKYQLGVTYTSMKYFDEALKEFTEVHRTRVRTLGSTHHSTLRAQSDIAFIKSEQGLYDDAFKILKDLIVLQEKHLQRNHPDTLRSKRFLGQVYARKGIYKEAEKILREVRQLQDDVLRMHHPSYLETGFQLGVTLKLAKQLEEALAILENVHHDQKMTLGEKHPLSLMTQIELGAIYSEKADNDKAWLLLEGACLIANRTRSQLSKLDLLLAKFYQGQVLYRQGKTDEALTQLKSTLEDQASSLGIEHPATMETKFHMAICLANAQNHNDAFKELLELHRVQPRVLGQHHPSTIKTKIALARTYSELGRNVEALEKFKEIENILEEKQIVDADTLKARRYRARTQSRLGSYDEALNTLSSVKKAQEELLGVDHPALLETLYQIGETYKQFDKFDDAFNAWKLVLQRQLRIFPNERHPKILQTKISLMGLEVISRTSEELPSKLEQLIRTGESVLGNKHRDVLKAKRLKAQAHSALGQFTDAMTIFEQVRQTQEEIFGAEHPVTLETLFQYGLCLEQLGKITEAENKLSRVQAIGNSALHPGHPYLMRVHKALERLRQKPKEIKKKSMFGSKSKNK